MPPTSGPRKIKAKVRVKPPAGDIASSGGDYGTRQAKRAAGTKIVRRNTRAVYADQPIRRRQQILANATGPTGAVVRKFHGQRMDRIDEVAHSQAQHDVPAADLIRARRFLAQHPEILQPHAHQDRGAFGSLVEAASSIAPKYAAAVFPGVTSALAGVDKLTGAHTLRTAGTIAANVPRDAAELAVGTPSSVAKLASTAVHDPARVPGMLVAPYEQLYHHPGQFVTEHPVSTALMVAPAGRMPGRAVGKVVRVAGKQTLERPAATLPGTALRQTRTGSRDVVVRAVQKRRDRKAGARVMSDGEVERRVDEFYAAGQKHRQRVEVAATRQARKRGMPKDQRPAHVQKALAGAERTLGRRFGQEFGASWQRTRSGAIVKPKQPTSGVVHASRSDAEAIAKRVPFDAVVRPAGAGYAVLPRVAVDRLGHHERVGTSTAIGARVMRSTRQAFTSTVLPLSPKWLTGNIVEAGLRAIVAGAGPTSYVRAGRVIRKLEEQKPGAGRALENRATGGGYFGGTVREMPRKTFEEEFAGGKLANIGHALTKAGKAPGPKQVHAVWRHVTEFVFNTLNGRIESTTQRAMLGKALKNSPLMERRIVGLSDRAVADAAKGLHGTEAQVELGRAVDRMYGRYSKFSPSVREAIAHWTPFAPWYGNVVTFLTKVLPADHPVLSSLLASVDASTEEWRKAAGLSLRGGKTRPGFLLGGYPAGGDQVLRLGRYTPFGASADPTQSFADLVLPQLLPALENLKGIDWRGQRLKYPGHDGREFNQGEKTIQAAVTLIESMVPGVAQAGRVTGLTPRYVGHEDKPSVVQGKRLGPALRKEVDPFMPTGAPTVKKKTAGTGWGGSGNGWGDPLPDLPALSQKYGLSQSDVDELAQKYGLQGP